MEKVIMHIDVNNAFLSWTAVYLLKNGFKKDIRLIPSVIAGDKTKRSGIILAKSMPAKKMGVKSAEPIYQAERKCKNLEIYPPNYNCYKEMSNKLFDYLYSLSPDIEIASIDECYLDYTKVKRLYGDEIKFAYMIKDTIKQKFGFTVNVGIGNNKLTAKMASDMEKPDKVHTLYNNEIKEKMWPLPIDDLFGVGKQTAIKLKELGIKTIENLATSDINMLNKFFKNMAASMINSANGMNNDEVETGTYINKGISNETTLLLDTTKDEEVYDTLLYLSEIVGYRIRKMHKYATTIAVIIKTNKFIRKSHQKKLTYPVNSDEEIYKFSKDIYKSIKNEDPIRLIGIRLDNLTENKIYQASLFENNEKLATSGKLDEALDTLKQKYGNKIISKASLIKIDKKETLKK